jgi:2'-5' RNA ligase
VLAREFAPEQRAFTPHLTVARFDPPVGLEPLEVVFESEPFGIDRLVLFRSHLRRPAPVYEPIGLFPFGP